MDLFRAIAIEYTSDFFTVYDIFFENIVLISIFFILLISLCLILKGIYEDSMILNIMWAAIVIFTVAFILYITVISRIGAVILENPLENLIYDITFVKTHVREIWGNILLFIPLGAGVDVLIKSKHSVIITVISGMIFSICIEVLQLYTKCGYCEIFDVVLNCVGMAIGCLLAELICNSEK